jgi:hypothetical protein
MLQSRSTGDRTLSKPEQWRVNDSYAAIRTGRLDDCDVLVAESDFDRWLAGDAPTPASEAKLPNIAPVEEQSGDPKPAPTPRRGKGRPGVRETCLDLFHSRRASETPLQRPQLAEAREIVRNWPTKDGPRKPRPETVSKHIAEAWIVADKKRR